MLDFSVVRLKARSFYYVESTSIWSCSFCLSIVFQFFLLFAILIQFFFTKRTLILQKEQLKVLRNIK